MNRRFRPCNYDCITDSLRYLKGASSFPLIGIVPLMSTRSLLLYHLTVVALQVGPASRHIHLYRRHHSDTRPLTSFEDPRPQFCLLFSIFGSRHSSPPTHLRRSSIGGVELRCRVLACHRPSAAACCRLLCSGQRSKLSARDLGTDGPCKVGHRGRGRHRCRGRGQPSFAVMESGETGVRRPQWVRTEIYATSFFNF